MERDKIDVELETAVEISTHTLTWSVTIFASYTTDKICISTHTLTWSVTDEVATSST